jgi:hypothetical protein
MSWPRKIVMFMGIFCVVVGFFPWRVSTTRTLADGSTETNQRFSLGIPRSPFLLSEKTETTPGPGVVQPDGSIVYKGGGYRGSTSIEFISWSMLSLILGAVLIEGARWSKRLRDSVPRQATS